MCQSVPICLQSFDKNNHSPSRGLSLHFDAHFSSYTLVSQIIISTATRIIFRIIKDMACMEPSTLLIQPLSPWPGC